jgi:hypothetical protein
MAMMPYRAGDYRYEVIDDGTGDLLNAAKCLERAEQFISEQ